MSDNLQQASRLDLSPNEPNLVSVDGTSLQQSSFAQNKEAYDSKQCHILLSSHQQTLAQFPTVSLILFSLH